MNILPSSYTIHLAPISKETINTDKHSSPLTAEGICSSCGYTFSPSNIFSVTGWKAAKETGMCQICISKLVESEEDDIEFINQINGDS